jgi:hypothetical protein
MLLFAGVESYTMSPLRPIYQQSLWGHFCRKGFLCPSRDESARQIAITGYLSFLQHLTVQSRGRRTQEIISSSQQSSQSVMSSAALDNHSICREILGMLESYMPNAVAVCSMPAAMSHMMFAGPEQRMRAGACRNSGASAHCSTRGSREWWMPIPPSQATYCSS